MPVFFYKGRKMSTVSQGSDLQGYGEDVRKELGRRIPNDKKVVALDVGTGFGINVAFLARWLRKGSTVWTVDPSKEVLQETKEALEKKKKKHHSDVKFAVATADALRFKSGLFDFVVCVMVLHHMEALRPALREMSRVLKANGTMLIADFKPRASHELKFRSRHDESDFFEPSTVREELARLGMTGKGRDFGMWYLVEAKRKKKRVRKTPAEVRGPSRA